MEQLHIGIEDRCELKCLIVFRNLQRLQLKQRQWSIFVGLCSVVCSVPLGFAYGMEGDPNTYAEMYSSLEALLKVSPTEILLNPNIVFALLQLIVVPIISLVTQDNVMTFVVIAMTSTAYAFLVMLEHRVSNGIVALGLFISTAPGFLTFCNLSRTAVGIVVFCIIYMFLIRKEICKGSEIMIAALVAAMVHYIFSICLCVSIFSRTTKSLGALMRGRVSLLILAGAATGTCVLMLFLLHADSLAFLMERELTREGSIPIIVTCVVIVMSILIKIGHGEKVEANGASSNVISSDMRDITLGLAVVYLAALVATRNGLLLERIAVVFIALGSVYLVQQKSFQAVSLLTVPLLIYNLIRFNSLLLP